MIDKICTYLITTLTINIPEDEQMKKDAISFTVHVMVEEIPKILILIFLGYFLNIFGLTMISLISIMIYRSFSGGFHLKSHLGCLIVTTFIFIGNVYISQYLAIENNIVRYIIYGLAWTFNLMMIKKYAPADTENVPLIDEKIRRKRRLGCYISMTLIMVVAFFVKDITISNILVYGTLLQSLTITRLAYKIFKNKYGHEVYA